MKPREGAAYKAPRARAERGAADDTARRAPRPAQARETRTSREEGGRQGQHDTRPAGNKRIGADRRSDEAPRRAPRTPDERRPRGERDDNARGPRAATRARPGEAAGGSAGYRSRGGPGERADRGDRGERAERSFGDARSARGERAPRDERAAGGGRPARGAAARPVREPRAETGDQPRKFARPAKPGAASTGAAAPRRETGFSRSGSGSSTSTGGRSANREGRAASETRSRPTPAKRMDTPAAKTGSLRVAKPVKASTGASQTAHRAIAADEDGLVRLSKRMSELGLCSRREADEWIENGWVRVDGERIDTLGTRIRPDQHIEITRDAQAAQSKQVTILLHKPVGYVSGQAEDGYEPAVTLITAANRWEGDRADTRFVPSHLRALAPAGRLDIDSTGLLVLTQDGRIAKQLIGEHSSVEKEYLVRVTFGDIETDVAEHFPAEKLALLRFGLSLDGAALKAAKVSWQNGEQLRFVLREGKKRQIRRMCELVGLQVVGLKRVRMGSVALGPLPQGKWRYLLPNEAF
ncbi:pseudouridine synthase [Trinickia sp.]|uniref:pseudouridine synthase n=1 Tax=Trinickia sp. TaxID=2571163 RepID=UPI003F81D67B